jgi:hypothetical protein
MDYQEPPVSNSVHIRYSSDFRQASGRYLLAANKPEAAKKKSAKDFPNVGGVALKQLPNGWLPAECKFNHNGTAKTFAPPNDDTCAIIMVYESLRKRYREPLERLLKLPVHTLNEKELGELEGLISYYKDDKQFRLTKAQTQDLGGKRVLLIEGFDTVVNREFYFVYSSDADVAFETYTKIWFVATPEASAKYKKEALTSIHSLKFMY